MKAFQTQRYKILFEEISKGGPAGYESVYLHSEADPASEELYKQLDSLDGRLLACENKSIRQRNGFQLVQALKEGKPLGIASGFKPSRACHFGHKLTSSAVSFFQKNGAKIFMPVADVEARLAGISEDVYSYWGADNLLDWGAIGVNLDATHVYLQSEEFRGFSLFPYTVHECNFDLPFDIYGAEKITKNFPFIIAGIIQVSDIILPQHSDFGNYHSFMVSGQDQDGHMKMTTELTKRALNRGDIKKLGVQTVPSGFYIPHIRGTSGDKASSSKPEHTLYLGSGPLNQDIDGRIKLSLEKLDNALKDSRLKENVERCALDMVRYIDFFNQKNNLNFREELENISNSFKRKIEESDEKERPFLIDNYLIKKCEKIGQDNVELVRELLPIVLLEHQKKRNIVLNYAIQRANYRDPGAWSLDDNKPVQPTFWEVPEKAVVDESKRNPTQWFDIVAEMRDKIIP